MTTPLRLHPDAREERRQVVRRMRDARAALRFRRAVDGIFDRIEASPEQFPEHGLIAVPNGRPLFYLVRRAVLPPPFPYVVFFYVRQGTAIVLAIAHGKRRPGYWAERS